MVSAYACRTSQDDTEVNASTLEDSEVCFAGITDLARGYAAGRYSPVDVTRAHLDRIEALDPRLHAYMQTLTDEAMAQAERATAELQSGAARGPLHGVPVAVKDLCFTRGVPTTGGMWIHRDFRPDFDATIVKRLRAAGAILLGKLTMTEGGMVENHPKIPTPVNPWQHDHWPGSSSNGPSVATAAGLCTASIGSDTGGSIRFPCAMTGVMGIKPTWGRVSVHGVFGLAAALDHVGPMARSAEDAGHVLHAVAGADPADPLCLEEAVPDCVTESFDLQGMRIALDTRVSLDGVEPVVRRALEHVAATLEQVGAVIVETPLPPMDPLARLFAPYCSAAAAVVHAETFPSRQDEYGPHFRSFLEAGRAVHATEIAQLDVERLSFSKALDALFERVDLLLVPVCWRTGLTMQGGLEEALAGPDGIASFTRFTAPFNFSGHPALTMPGGFDDRGVPIGFQLVAPHLAEARLVSAGRAYQAATDWHRKRPPVDRVPEG